MKRTDQVLAGIGVDSGLTADRGVDHAEQGGGHVDDVDTAQPRRGGEARDVGGRSTAEAYDRILAANPDAAQHFPDKADDGQFLSRLGVWESRCGAHRFPCRTNDFRIASAVWVSTGWCRMATLWRPSSVRASSFRSPVPMITG